MNGQELATAVKYKVNLTVIVVNNGMYAHDPDAPGTDLSGTGVSATGTHETRISRCWRAPTGCHGETVTRTEEFAEA